MKRIVTLILVLIIMLSIVVTASAEWNFTIRKPGASAQPELTDEQIARLQQIVDSLNRTNSDAKADTKKIIGAVLPEPNAFFKNAISFTTQNSYSSAFGTMTTGDFKYKDLSVAQEYVQCIAENYPFSLDSKLKNAATSWGYYNEDWFFNYTGGDTKNVGTVTSYTFDSASANVYVDFTVDPSSDLVKLTIYYGDNISFRDNGYRCSKDPVPVPTPTRNPDPFCSFCRGTGEVECSRCGGRGQIQERQTTYSFGKKQEVMQWVDCPDCNFGRKPCPWCS